MLIYIMLAPALASRPDIAAAGAMARFFLRHTDRHIRTRRYP
jgi:hypothetical protein